MGLRRAGELLSDALKSIQSAREALSSTLDHLAPQKRGAAQAILARLTGESEALADLLARVKRTADQRHRRLAVIRGRAASPQHSAADVRGAAHQAPTADDPSPGPRRRPTPEIDREIVRIAKQALNPPQRVPGLEQELRDLVRPENRK